MTTETAEKVISELHRHAEKIKSGEQQVVGTMSLGDTCRQGDLYLTRIVALPKSAKSTTNKQLAPGTTQGSRHEIESHISCYTAEGREVAEMIREANPQTMPDVSKYIGPVVVFEQESSVMHPEHGWLRMPVGTVCAVSYQRNLDQEEQEHRVQD